MQKNVVMDAGAVKLLVDTNVSEKQTVSIFRAKINCFDNTGIQ